MDGVAFNSNMTQSHPMDQGVMARRGKIGDRFSGVADLHALKRTCDDFESIFVYTLLKTMRASLPKTWEDDTKREMYTSLGDLELARSIAYGRGLGLGDLLFEDLKQRIVGSGP
jgi:flagellar protein FlgJ